jgi:hypothetical protein
MHRYFFIFDLPAIFLRRVKLLTGVPLLFFKEPLSAKDLKNP